MDPKEVQNIRKIAEKVKAKNEEERLEIARELNEVAKIIIELNHLQKRKGLP